MNFLEENLQVQIIKKKILDYSENAWRALVSNCVHFTSFDNIAPSAKYIHQYLFS